MAIDETARIYNLFPRLLGTIPQWQPHLKKIRQMDFNWLFLNPFHYPGFSGSLYAVKDFYQLNPLFFDPNRGQTEMEQLKWIVDEAHKQGLKIMMDLVLNHTAIDHPFTEEHKDWYKLDSNGEIVRPGAWDDDHWISWGDLAEIDNESSLDKIHLWQYWLELVNHYLKLGFDGFRCDAAYKLPSDFWEHLIGRSKEHFPTTVWFAESLGCPIEDTISLGQSGFNYTFNSSKWWDYEENWCLEQYKANAIHAKSVSFPESHDTERLFKESDRTVVEQKYLVSALFSAGVMIPLGFEFGFKKRMNVVETSPDDYEVVHHDFSNYITRVNQLKSQYQIFNEESFIDRLLYKNNNNISILIKTSLNFDERCLLIINKDFKNSQECIIHDLLFLLSWDRHVEDISLSNPIIDLSETITLTLNPGKVQILYSKRLGK